MYDSRILNQLRALGGLLSTTVQKVTSTGTTAAVGTALKKHTPYWIIGDLAFHIKRGVFGATEAAATDMFVPANVPVVLWTGDSTAFAIIRDAGTGTCNVYIAEVEADTEPVPSSATGQYAG